MRTKDEIMKRLQDSFMDGIKDLEIGNNVSELLGVQTTLILLLEVLIDIRDINNKTQISVM